jgi:hypothetical protein
MDLKYRRVRMVGGIPRSLHHALVALGTARFGGEVDIARDRETTFASGCCPWPGSACGD